MLEMTPDYPAAHSMDTEWFAVDECGHVAVFITGESGIVPVDACTTADDDGARVAKALAGTGEWPDWREVAEERGLYAYECPDDFPGPYERGADPARPMLVTELPDAAREQLTRVRWKGCFASADSAHPARHFECVGWSAGWVDPETKVYRPLPGMEEEFAGELESFPEGFEGFTIERTALPVPTPAAGRPKKLSDAERRALVESTMVPQSWWKRLLWKLFVK